MAIKAAFKCFSKTWKFREDQNSQKLSWRSWRGKKLRYLAEEFISISDLCNEGHIELCFMVILTAEIQRQSRREKGEVWHS